MDKSLSDKLSVQKAALYIRVSTHWQIDKDSLPVQRDELINYSKYALGINKYEVFEDAGYSAKNTDRPAFQQMMARLRTGEFTHLCVWKIDRISRNLLDFAEMYSEIKKLGVTFVSKNEQFDTSSAMGEAMLKIILVFAELERNITSERVTAIMIARAEKGLWNGGKVPFGYSFNKETNSFDIVEDEAARVRLVYDLYEEYESLICVTRELNERGIKPRSANNWNPATVRIILTNPCYTGILRYNYHNESKSNGNTSGSKLKRDGEWIIIENHHEPIVSKERQDRIAEKLLQNRRSNRRDPKKYERKHSHIFAGLLVCGYCGHQMQCSTDRPRSDGYRPSIYACSRKRRFSDCENKYISDITLAPFVLNYISNMLKAQKNCGKSTTLQALEKKLLRGEWFSEVEHIEESGLKETLGMLVSGVSDAIYISKAEEVNQRLKEIADERDLLAAERRKKERALNRLRTIYLYDEQSIPEREFVATRRELEDEIRSIDKRLEEVEERSSEQFSLSDDEFLSKASLFLMTNQLLEQRFVNFESLIRKIEPRVLKQFIASIIQKIVIKGGRVMSIRFKNGVEHKFSYKD